VAVVFVIFDTSWLSIFVVEQFGLQEIGWPAF